MGWDGTKWDELGRDGTSIICHPLSHCPHNKSHYNNMEPFGNSHSTEHCLSYPWDDSMVGRGGIGQVQLGWDGTGRDGTGRDGTGRDGTGHEVGYP